MALTVDQLVTRIEYLEATVNRIILVLKKMATREQLIGLTSIRQNEIEDLQGRITAVENQVEALELLNKV